MTIFNSVFKSFVVPPFTPGANTVVYYPLDSTNQLNDLSGNGNTLTNNTGYTFGTYQGVSCVSMSNGYLCSLTPTVGTTRTALAWIYSTMASGVGCVVCTGDDHVNSMINVGVDNGKGVVGDWNNPLVDGTTTITNGWHLIGVTWISGGGMKLYVDAVLEATSPNYTKTSGSIITIGSKYADTGVWSEKFTGYISNVIVENAERTLQDFSDYFNKTKADYGIS